MRGEYRFLERCWWAWGELPPRARRIPTTQLFVVVVVGTTSACAENTYGVSSSVSVVWNYLRVRGEYSENHGDELVEVELPPRARRIRLEFVKNTIVDGTTSACAENTGFESVTDFVHQELPPRARRIRGFGCFCVFLRGTTSACAENTRDMQATPAAPRNYLRVRGEYPWYRSMALRRMELPPRARRILSTYSGVCNFSGTTSACAENTINRLKRSSSRRNYLRVRGEYRVDGAMVHDLMELPPRARRILAKAGTKPVGFGTTSACAENTRKLLKGRCGKRNYLRVRGEYLCWPWLRAAWMELPPRARRIPIRLGYRSYPVGTTSACAENTLNELGLL